MGHRQLGATGIQAKVDLKPLVEIRNALNARQYDAALIDLTFANSPDPDPYPFWHQTQIESGQNFSGFDSRNMSEILEQTRVTPSYADRAKFYRAFQTQFVDQTPAILLYYPVFNYAVDKKCGAFNWVHSWIAVIVLAIYTIGTSSPAA